MKKDIEWLKGRLRMRKLFKPQTEEEIGYNMAIDEFSEYVDQLDEPVTLSQKWIDKNHFEIDNWHEDLFKSDGETSIDHTPQIKVIAVQDLQKQLVPKQELPTIPKFVAEEIKKDKERGYDVYDSIDLIIETDGGGLPSISDWVARNIDKYARAWLDGFTIANEEKEKKYVVKTNLGTYLIIDTSKREWDYTSIPPQDDDIQYAYKFDDRHVAEGIAKLVEGKVEVCEE